MWSTVMILKYTFKIVGKTVYYFNIINNWLNYKQCIQI